MAWGRKELGLERGAFGAVVNIEGCRYIRVTSHEPPDRGCDTVLISRWANDLPTKPLPASQSTNCKARPLFAWRAEWGCMSQTAITLHCTSSIAPRTSCEPVYVAKIADDIKDLRPRPGARQNPLLCLTAWAGCRGEQLPWEPGECGVSLPEASPLPCFAHAACWEQMGRPGDLSLTPDPRAGICPPPRPTDGEQATSRLRPRAHPE
ncbi:hypothetical protein NDU88_002018 [Pleurodeles waltl]|uniref:Uncharacterized protein n=1 Tax=Pleurodeles waltl TaxID=8319 RepID=A0AAV7U830_PLEWA|nr:hypothetical protein NDU88_002018 [Pleurodeles waltl]